MYYMSYSTNQTTIHEYLINKNHLLFHLFIAIYDHLIFIKTLGKYKNASFLKVQFLCYPTFFNLFS